MGGDRQLVARGERGRRGRGRVGVHGYVRPVLGSKDRVGCLRHTARGETGIGRGLEGRYRAIERRRVARGGRPTMSLWHVGIRRLRRESRFRGRGDGGRRGGIGRRPGRRTGRAGGLGGRLRISEGRGTQRWRLIGPSLRGRGERSGDEQDGCVRGPPFRRFGRPLEGGVGRFRALLRGQRTVGCRARGSRAGGLRRGGGGRGVEQERVERRAHRDDGGPQRGRAGRVAEEGVEERRHASVLSLAAGPAATSRVEAERTGVEPPGSCVRTNAAAWVAVSAPSRRPWLRPDAAA